MIEAASISTDINLKSFSDELLQAGLQHWIVEESGQQVIRVQSEPAAKVVRQALAQWLEHQQQHSGSAPATESIDWQLGSIGQWINAAWHAVYLSPITWCAILMCAGVAVVSQLGNDRLAVEQWNYPLLPTSDLASLLLAINSPITFLKTLSPMFLHFGELHLVFNMLWLWYFGRQLEAMQSRWWFLFLMVATAFVSNTAQYLALGFNNFGGMSGVLYGLVGYSWFIHFCMPTSNLLINNNMFLVFVVALIAMEIFASSWIATTAHIAGLGTGLFFGIAAVLIYRFILRRQSIGYNRAQ